MITCPYCEHQMPEGALICEECGLSLLVDPETTRLEISSDKLGAQPGWGTVTLSDDQDILVQIGELAQPLDIQPDEDFTMGRGDGSDSDTDVKVNLDLSKFGALEKGVSRVHAALRRGEGVLAVVDLESTNGTFLNGHRLAAHQPHLVRDGDEIRLGKLAMQVYFRSI